MSIQGSLQTPAKIGGHSRTPQRGVPTKECPPNTQLSTPLRSLALIFLFALMPLARGAEPFDILIKGGTLYDGTGDKPRLAAVAIRGDRIAGVGDFKPETAV